MTNKTKTYDAGDMHDAVSLAAHDMNWMSTALNIIRMDIARLHEKAKNGKLSQYDFDQVRTQIDMFSFLADSRHEYHANESDRFEQEWEAAKQKASA